MRQKQRQGMMGNSFSLIRYSLVCDPTEDISKTLLTLSTPASGIPETQFGKNVRYAHTRMSASYFHMWIKHHYFVFMFSII